MSAATHCNRRPLHVRLLTPLLLLFSAFWLAACEPGVLAGGFAGPVTRADEPVRVALLLPGGSGQAGDEVLARSLENAARLAVSDLDGVQIDLRVYRDGGSASQAAAMAIQAIDDGAQIILGPVFAESARAVGQAVAGRNVNVLSFSNNVTVAGGNVFVIGPTFNNTANRLAQYAVRNGQSRIMIIHERNEAGELGRSAIVSGTQRAGGSVVATQSFDFSQQGVVDALSRITAAARDNQADALFLTSDSAGALPLLAQLLPDSGLTPSQYQYIGLTRWDQPSSTLTLSGLQGGWFALPDPGLTAQFEARYRAAYGSAPHPIAGLAYDGVAAIGALVRSGQGDALSRNALTQASGFAGVNGVFRLLPDGTNERGLAVAEIRNNEVVVVDPAPRSFPGAGF